MDCDQDPYADYPSLQDNGRLAPSLGYKELRVWQRGMDLVEQCYRLTRAFPREEIYGLTSQLRRAAVSIPANIAEGYGREQRGDYMRFIQIAMGSLREVETLLQVVQRVGIAPCTDTQPILALCDSLGRQLWALLRSLEHKSKSMSPNGAT